MSRWDDRAFRVQCPKCPMKVIDIQKHLKMTHAMSKQERRICIYRRVKCPICSKEAQDIKQHIRIVHDKILDISCTQCDKRFIRNSELNKHVERVHIKME